MGEQLQALRRHRALRAVVALPPEQRLLRQRLRHEKVLGVRSWHCLLQNGDCTWEIWPTLLCQLGKRSSLRIVRLGVRVLYKWVWMTFIRLQWSWSPPCSKSSFAAPTIPFKRMDLLYSSHNPGPARTTSGGERTSVWPVEKAVTTFHEEELLWMNVWYSFGRLLRVKLPLDGVSTVKRLGKVEIPRRP